MSGDPSSTRFGVHVDVLKLGVVSLLTDLSSEMLFAVFAVYFTTVAGASAALLGWVEGVADFSASSLDYFAGWLSDRSGERKRLTLAGYGFSTLAKGILPFSNSIAGLGVFRVVERLGKSFRGPPRDAWLAEVAAREARGLSFGIHKALDKSGAVIGPLLAWEILSRLEGGAGAYRVLFVIALIPAVLSVAALSLVKDRPGIAHRRENPWRAWRTLSADFRRYLVPAGIFALAYFSFGFLLLRARSIGFAVGDIALLYALVNVACVLAAPIVGRLGDRWGRVPIVMMGYLSYLLMSLGFIWATTKGQAVVLFVLYGVFFAIDEAQSKAFVADLEAERRASAMGIYNALTGLLYLPASVMAGALWLGHPAGAFLLAAGLSAAAIVALAILRPGNASMTRPAGPGAPQCFAGSAGQVRMPSRV